MVGLTLKGYERQTGYALRPLIAPLVVAGGPRHHLLGIALGNSAIAPSAPTATGASMTLSPWKVSDARASPASQSGGGECGEHQPEDHGSEKKNRPLAGRLAPRLFDGALGGHPTMLPGAAAAAQGLTARSGVASCPGSSTPPDDLTTLE